MIKNSKYKRKIWETSTLSARIISWILNIDIIFVASFSHLIPKKILDIAKIAAINFHPSYLPNYRGGAPEFCAIYNGEKKTGISFHLMNEKFDRGNVILQKNLDISDDETTISLKKKLSKEACDSLADLFLKIKSGNLKGEIQNESQATYCKLDRNSDYIHKDLSVKKIKNVINAFYGDIYEPYCKIKNKKIYILSYSNKDGFPYKCKDGVIFFDTLRFKNKIYRGSEIEKIL